MLATKPSPLPKLLGDNSFPLTRKCRWKRLFDNRNATSAREKPPDTSDSLSVAGGTFECRRFRRTNVEFTLASVSKRSSSARTGLFKVTRLHIRSQITTVFFEASPFEEPYARTTYFYGASGFRNPHPVVGDGLCEQ